MFFFFLFFFSYNSFDLSADSCVSVPTPLGSLHPSHLARPTWICQRLTRSSRRVIPRSTSIAQQSAAASAKRTSFFFWKNTLTDTQHSFFPVQFSVVFSSAFREPLHCSSLCTITSLNSEWLLCSFPPPTMPRRCDATSSTRRRGQRLTPTSTSILLASIWQALRAAGSVGAAAVPVAGFRALMSRQGMSVSARSLVLRRLLPPSLRQIARDTCVSPACVLKYQRLLNGWIADGRCPSPDDTSCCPGNFDALLATGLPKRGGVRAACCKWTPVVDERVRALVAAQPQLFLDEICVALRAAQCPPDTAVADPAAAAVLADCSSPPVNSPAAASAAVVCVSRSTVCRRLQLAGLRRVVVAHVAPQRSSARVIEERARFVAQVLPTLPAADSGLLLCCDESHVDRKCEHRRYGRAPHGQRPVVLQPHNGGDSARERHTLIRAVGISLRHISPPRDRAAGRPSAPTLQLVSANRISSGSTNSATFTDFLHRQLGPLAHSMQEQFAKAHADLFRQPDVPHALLHPPSPLELPPEPPSSPSPAAGASGGADGAGRRRRRPQRAPRRPLAPVQPATAAWITCAPPPLPPRPRPAGDHGGGRVHRRHPAQRRLAPTQLRPPPPVVVLLDNWVGHHSRVVQHAVNTYWSNTLRAVFVPPYSPDFNWPIECSFHDIKSQLRRDRVAAPPGVPAAAVPAAASNAAQDGCGERDHRGLGVPLPPLTASVLADVVRHSDARRDPFENVTTLLHRARHAGYALENSPWLAAELDRVSPHVF